MIMQRSRYVPPMVALALCVAPATAQQDGPNSTRQDGHASEAHVKGTQAGSAKALDVHRAEDVVGLALEDASHRKIGSIEELVIDTATGRIALALVQVESEVLGDDAEEGLRAIPWHALNVTHPAPESSTSKSDDTECRASLKGTSSRLRTAPVVREEGPLDELQRRAESAFDEAAGAIDDMTDEDDMDSDTSEASMNRSSQTAISAYTGLVRCSTLMDVDVEFTALAVPADEEQDVAGDVERIYLDTANGRIAYIVIGHGGLLGMGETQVPLPWSSVRATPKPEGDGIALRTFVDKSRLEQAPALPGEESEATSAQWMDRLYTFYSADMYWESESVSAGYRPDERSNR